MILYATDLHGKHYEILFERASKDDIDVAIFGGDLLPKETGSGDVRKELEKLIFVQRNFLKNYFIPKLEEFKKREKDFYLMLGNDDFACNLFLLEKAEGQGLCKLLHNKRQKLTKDIDVVGYPFVPLTPFAIKDFEKFDDNEIPLGDASLFGYAGKGNKIIKKEFDINNRKDNIVRDIEKISENASRTIYVIHAPPFNTSLDVTSYVPPSHPAFLEEHVGSRAVKAFILQKQPLATFHGHIHESYALTGKYMEKISNTVCINPGQDYGIVDNRIVKAFNYVLFDPYDIENAKLFSIGT